ncbi:hypothetical protein P73_1001 [Celeribacter indicus]|uniref:Uncharacterized protein n=1 Tax=Celeribacter indicus TaxID=1208324 RepID=A0A0B5DYB9_9RHOB|nr:hypothetical protein P73_1001 [Celeribacter indicus]
MGLAIGAGWGAFVARRRGGKLLDILQYAAGFGLAFALVAMFAGILLLRLS